MAKKPTARVSYQSCEIFCSVETTCPLCRVTVAANTMHRCGSAQAESFVSAIVGALRGTIPQPAGDAGRKRLKQ